MGFLPVWGEGNPFTPHKAVPQICHIYHSKKFELDILAGSCFNMKIVNGKGGG